MVTLSAAIAAEERRITQIQRTSVMTTQKMNIAAMKTNGDDLTDDDEEVVVSQKEKKGKVRKRGRRVWEPETLKMRKKTLSH